MSCTFWNRRRRLRQQIGIEREVKEESPPPEQIPNANTKKPPPRKKEDKS